MKLPKGIKIVIPSFKRHKEIQRKTLRFLERMEVDPADVSIYMANEDQMLIYDAYLPPRWAARLKMGVPTVNAVRNLIQRSHPVGTELLYMDDDIHNVVVRHKNITMKTKRKDQYHYITPTEFRTLMAMGFSECKANNLFIWGVYPTNNPMHMRNRTFIGLTYIVAAFFGMVVRHDQDTMTQYPVKEDHERTLRYYVKDGGVIRIEGVGLQTTYFGGGGGLHADGVEARHKWANQYIDKIVKEFPSLCCVKQRTKYRDIWLYRLPQRSTLI